MRTSRMSFNEAAIGDRMPGGDDKPTFTKVGLSTPFNAGGGRTLLRRHHMAGDVAGGTAAGTRDQVAYQASLQHFNHYTGQLPEAIERIYELGQRAGVNREEVTAEIAKAQRRADEARYADLLVNCRHHSEPVQREFWTVARRLNLSKETIEADIARVAEEQTQRARELLLWANGGI